jgi:hypothetical protein
MNLQFENLETFSNHYLIKVKYDEPNILTIYQLRKLLDHI